MRVYETIHVPISKATTPSSGRCICNNYWSSHPKYGICFYSPNSSRYYKPNMQSPACNSDEKVSLILNEKLYNEIDEYENNYEVIFLETVYISSCLKYEKEMK